MREQGKLRGKMRRYRENRGDLRRRGSEQGRLRGKGKRPDKLWKGLLRKHMKKRLLKLA